VCVRASVWPPDGQPHLVHRFGAHPRVRAREVPVDIQHLRGGSIQDGRGRYFGEGIQKGKSKTGVGVDRRKRTPIINR
jgi:hypothetical protein